MHLQAINAKANHAVARPGGSAFPTLDTTPILTFFPRADEMGGRQGRASCGMRTIRIPCGTVLSLHAWGSGFGTVRRQEG